MNRITLIVDDDSMMRSLNRKLIISTNLSGKPFLFSNGKEALEFLLENYSEESRYLIFLDIEMPEMNGWELLNQIDFRFPAINFYVIISSTALDRPYEERKIFYRQVKHYCGKPIPNELMKLIKDEIDSDSWII